MERFLFSTVRTWAVLLICLVTFAVGGLWAYGIMVHNVPPALLLREIQAFVRGMPGDDRSLLTRLMTGHTYFARAFPAERDHIVLPPEEFTAVTLASDAPAPLPEIAGMRVANPGGETRYFVIYGFFAFPEVGTVIGAIALDSTGKLYRAWPERVEGGTFLGAHIGMAVTPDGVIAHNAKGILSAQSWCGEKLWQADWAPHPDGRVRKSDDLDSTDWHHDVSYYDGRFWTFLGPSIAAVDAETGEMVEQITALDMMRWSWAEGLSLMDGGTMLFNPRRLDREPLAELLPEDPFHFNKVEPLSAELAPLYPGLEAGDLLVNLRNNDLVAILRPSEERFVWWRLGMSSRAHDTTFVDGAIELFNNAPFTYPPTPTLRRFDMDTQSFEDFMQLDQFGMWMRQKGNFVRDGEQLVLVDDEAGRMIASRLDGTLEFVFENGHDNGSDVINLQLRNAVELTAETFERLQASCS